MKALFLLPVFVVACFREAPPCDQATRDHIKRTCKTLEECERRILERDQVCSERFRRGE